MMTGNVRHILNRDSKMIVLDSKIGDVRRDRDFCLLYTSDAADE